MLVCDHCQATLYWDENAVLNVGKQAMVPKGDTRLFMHASAKVDKKSFRVIGHLTYDHGRGTWDEWHLELDNGTSGWISEDGRRLTWEHPIDADQPLPAPSNLEPGTTLTLAGTRFSVREVGMAALVASEGQLPFVVLPDESYVYADIVSDDGNYFGTIEYDNTGAPHCYIGRPLSHDRLIIEGEPEPHVAASSAAKDITCGTCNAPQESPSAPGAKTMVCPYCGSALDLTTAEARVLGVNPTDVDIQFEFEIGEACTFDGVNYEVSGRAAERDTEGYQSIDYLLYNAETGYRWLSSEDNHYTLLKPSNLGGGFSPFSVYPKNTVYIGDDEYNAFSRGGSVLQYVDGALPWRAVVGDRHQWAEMINPPRIFVAESDEAGDEVEFFEGRWLSTKEVQTAFKRDKSLRQPRGIHPAQPNLFWKKAKPTVVVLILFVLIYLGLLLWSFGSSGTLIFKQVFSQSEYAKETFSSPFTVGRGEVMELAVNAPLNNSWIALSVALINQQQMVVSESGAEISYYHGVEGGESWSEGSNSSSSYFKAPPPGNYWLLIKGESGSGTTGPALGEQLSVKLYQGGMLSRYYLIGFVVLLGVAALLIYQRIRFEKTRWEDAGIFRTGVGDDDVFYSDDDDDD